MNCVKTEFAVFISLCWFGLLSTDRLFPEIVDMKDTTVLYFCASLLLPQMDASLPSFSHHFCFYFENLNFRFTINSTLL